MAREHWRESVDIWERAMADGKPRPSRWMVGGVAYVSRREGVVCTLCGAVVSDVDVHSRYHAATPLEGEG